MKAVRYRLTWSELFDPPVEFPFMLATEFELEEPELLSEKPKITNYNNINVIIKYAYCYILCYKHAKAFG